MAVAPGVADVSPILFPSPLYAILALAALGVGQAELLNAAAVPAALGYAAADAVRSLRCRRRHTALGSENECCTTRLAACFASSTAWERAVLWIIFNGERTFPGFRPLTLPAELLWFDDGAGTAQRSAGPPLIDLGVGESPD